MGGAHRGRDGPALRMHDVVKHYERGAPAYGSLRDSLARLFGRAEARETVPALDHVDLELARGETLGVVGDNGAGKSTLLKVVARITHPDRGRVEVRGRLSSLIELGAGFHPELTGRENVLLHGSILGLSRRRLLGAVGDIAAFAGLGGAMDTPVKFFSTGMYARLGFAVAVHAAPDVLLVDEVLSVGDRTFREACYDRIRTIRERGTAILLVSHDLPVVAALCDRALRLEAGRVVDEGPAPSVVEAYAGA
jgi:ABC-type polysaccharide/polyol phosphate transport system ATPase subunit